MNSGQNKQIVLALEHQMDCEDSESITDKRATMDQPSRSFSKGIELT